VRNFHGFNRFRLVVAGDDMALNADGVGSQFSAETGVDEKDASSFREV
jgi:hypothetical protein